MALLDLAGPGRPDHVKPAFAPQIIYCRYGFRHEYKRGASTSRLNLLRTAQRRLSSAVTAFVDDMQRIPS